MTFTGRAIAATCCLCATACASSTTNHSANTKRGTTTAKTSTTTATSTTSTAPQTTTTHGQVTTTAASRPPSTPPTNPAPARRIIRGDTARAEVAFSFDAGSDPGSTARILAILASDRIHASFGITGDWARANPTLLEAIVHAGHQLINHSDSHRSFTGVSTRSAPLSTAERIAEVTGGEQSIRNIVRVNPQPWFRPPYGDMDANGDAILGRLGYRFDVLWTVDSLGWKGTPASDVAQRCIDGAGNGVIYLFHVGRASTDADALQAIVDGIRARGFTIGSVGDVVT